MNITARERLAKIVKEIRGNRSQRAFARDLGVTGTAVRAWEETRSIPDIDNMKRIGLLAGFKSLDDFLSYLNGEALEQPKEIDKIINQLRQMPLEQVVQITNAGIERLKSAAQEQETSNETREKARTKPTP